MKSGTTRKEPIQFSHWSSSFDLTSDGKHIMDMPEDFPLAIGCNRFSFDRPLAPNYHDYFEISHICEGEGIFRVGSMDYAIEKGGILVVGNTEVHTLVINEHDPVDVLSIFFMPELIYRPGGRELDFEYIRCFYHRDDDSSNYIPPNKIDSSNIYDLMSRSYHADNQGLMHSRMSIRNYLQEVLLLIYLYYEKSLVTANTHHDRRVSSIQRMNPVFQLVENRYQERISLEKVASSVCMSSQYFCRFFKHVTGSTFMEYLQQIRIDKAKHLLLTGDLPITQIAYEVGFGSLSYFNRVFRKLTLLTPSQFLNMAKERDEELHCGDSKRLGFDREWSI